VRWLWQVQPTVIPQPELVEGGLVRRNGSLDNYHLYLNLYNKKIQDQICRGAYLGNAYDGVSCAVHTGINDHLMN
jgi:hypothetical protein